MASDDTELYHMPSDTSVVSGHLDLTSPISLNTSSNYEPVSDTSETYEPIMGDHGGQDMDQHDLETYEPVLCQSNEATITANSVLRNTEAKANGGTGFLGKILNRGSGPVRRSLRHVLMRDALPSEDHYRNMDSINLGSKNKQRPSMTHLIDPNEATNSKIEYNRRKSTEEAAETKSGKVIKFGWFEGVYMRCLLNIWGVMLFLRLTWVVGQAGIIEGIAVITLANIVTTITTISMSAVCTNGQIKAGGIYYMISRSLGPEFGGAIGLMFTLANSIAVSMYIIGFCESVIDMCAQYGDGFNGIVSEVRLNDVRLVGSLTLVALLAIGIAGMDWVTRVQKLLLVLLFASQVDFIVGSFLTPSEEKVAKGFIGYDEKVFSENLWSDYRPNEQGKMQSFFSVFAVFFPAVTGIVAGANLSGDLKDPGMAIPKGTLAAIGTTFVTYIVYAAMVGAVAVRYASGIAGEVGFGVNGTNQTMFEENNITMSFTDCLPNENSTRWCDYGIAKNQQMMEVISAWGPLIYAGCFAATISSAIASLVGAPRVLQALAKDKLYPHIEFFAKGYGANNDPVRGYVLVFTISLVCILIGDLDVVSSLLSNFFVASYALINFSVFHSSITKSPGWRPSFKYYNMWVSLFGTILCVVVMFLMDHVTALVTFITIVCLYMYVSIRKPPVNWGSSTQAQSFVNALKTTQGLSGVDDHVKNYRPKIIVLTGDPETRPCLIDFANLITKRISLLTTTNIVKNSTANWKSIENLKKRSQLWLTENKIKAFHTVSRQSNFSEGVRATLELNGLGKLSPNMMMMGFKENWRMFPSEAEEYYKAIQTAFEMNLAVGILRINGGMDISEIVGATERVKMMPRCESVLSTSSSRPELLPDDIYAPPSELSMGGIYAPPSSIYAPDSSIYAPPSDMSLGSIYSPCSVGSIYAPMSVRSDISGTSNGTSRDSGLYLDASQLGKSMESGLNLPHDKQKRRKRSSKMVMPSGLTGANIDETLIDKMVQFRDKSMMQGTVDIYWLYDDGGLTLLIPHILITRAKFSKCKLRVFFLCSKKHEVVKETMNMVKLLAKFRIEAEDVIIIDDATKKPREDTKQAFEQMVRSKPYSSVKKFMTPAIVINDNDSEHSQIISEDILSKHKEKTNFHLRISEVVKEHSSAASLVVMTLPMVRKGHVAPLLYLAWLDMLTVNMPPCLMVRGNQTPVLTFYS